MRTRNYYNRRRLHEAIDNEQKCLIIYTNDGYFSYMFNGAVFSVDEFERFIHGLIQQQLDCMGYNTVEQMLEGEEVDDLGFDLEIYQCSGDRDVCNVIKKVLNSGKYRAQIKKNGIADDVEELESDINDALDKAGLFDRYDKCRNHWLSAPVPLNEHELMELVSRIENFFN